MDKNLVGAVIGVVVALFVISAALMPFVNDMSRTHDTFDNTLYSEYQMKELENGDSWTYSDSKWYYGDAEIPLSTAGSLGLIQTDNLVIQQYGLYRGISLAGNSVTSFTVGEGEYSLNEGESKSYTAGFGAVDNGDYVLKSATNPAYILEDSEVFSSASAKLSSSSSSQILIVVTGSIEDGFTATVTNVKSSTVTDIVVGECTVDAEAVAGYDGLYKISAVNVPITATYGGDSVDVTYMAASLIIPKTVTIEISNHASATEIALFNVIPTFCILAILVGVVYVGLRKDEY